MGARKRILALCDGTRSSTVLAAQAFCDRSYVCRILLAGQRSGSVYISGWEKTPTRNRALYMFGAGENVAEPRSSSTMRVRAMLERMSADDRDRWRNRTNTRRRKVKQDPLGRVFFGGER